MKEGQVANFHGQASYAYGCLNGAKHFTFMDNTSLLLSHATKECQVANFHWQTSDAYAYV